MNKQRVDDLMSAFRKVHGQIQTSVNTTTKGIPKKREKRNITSEKYSKFMEKYKDSYTLYMVTDVKSDFPKVKEYNYYDIMKMRKEYPSVRFYA